MCVPPGVASQAQRTYRVDNHILLLVNLYHFYFSYLNMLRKDSTQLIYFIRRALRMSYTVMLESAHHQLERLLPLFLAFAAVSCLRVIE